MFDPYLTQKIIAQTQSHQAAYEVRALLAAEQLYQRAYRQGQWRRLWAALTRQSRHLLDLAEVEASSRVINRHSAGSQTVPLTQIRGSASTGRERDFDLDFYPLQEHDQARWKSVAVVWQMGLSLPAIQLIQVGQIYFVQDGHHRVSVARALGQKYIDAAVMVWQVAEPLTETQPATPALQPGECLMPA